MSNPKRQHYIPRCHIARFADEHDNFWFFDREKPEKGVHHRSRESVFFKIHHNTLVSAAGERDYSVEKELSKIEGEFRKTVKRALDGIERCGRMELGKDELSFLTHYTELQWRRSPDFERREVPADQDEARLSIVIREIQKETGAQLSIQEVRALDLARISGDYSDALALQALRKMAGDMLVSDDEILTSIGGKEWESGTRSGIISGRYSALDDGWSLLTAPVKSWWVKLPSKYAFVLGSFPIAVLSSGSSERFHPLNGIVFPLSSSIAFVHGRKEAPFVLEQFADREIIRRLNVKVVRQSTSFGSCSFELTRSLSKLMN